MTAPRDGLPGSIPRLDKELLLKIFTEVSVRPGHKVVAKPVANEIESEVPGVAPDKNRPPDDEQ
jgi:hypothetical protein